MKKKKKILTRKDIEAVELLHDEQMLKQGRITEREALARAGRNNLTGASVQFGDQK